MINNNNINSGSRNNNEKEEEESEESEEQESLFLATTEATTTTTTTTTDINNKACCASNITSISGSMGQQRHQQNHHGEQQQQQQQGVVVLGRRRRQLQQRQRTSLQKQEQQRQKQQQQQKHSSSSPCSSCCSWSNNIESATCAFVIVIALLVLIKHYQEQQEEQEVSRSFITSDNNIFNDPYNISEDILLQLDAILILGGGKPISLYKPPIYVQHRCDDAAIIRTRTMITAMNTNNKKQQVLNKRTRRRKNTTNKGSSYSSSSEEQQQLFRPAILCLSAGTAHLPQLMDNQQTTGGGIGSGIGLPIWESTSSAAYLSSIYNITEEVYVETTSYDTIGNAYFARTSHTDINGWRQLLIITSEFHMARTKAIFDWIFYMDDNNDDNGKADKKKKNMKNDDDGYVLYYLSSKNDGLTNDALKARNEKEMNSLYTIQNEYVVKYQTLKDVYWFLTHQHGLYTTNKLIQRGDVSANSDTTTTSSTTITNELIKKSYGG